MKLFAITIIFLHIIITQCEECTRPNILKKNEDVCWTKEIEIVQRLHQTSRNVLNFAKKKLGMEVDDKHEPLKCEYYRCILKELHMLDVEGIPSFDSIQEWIESYVVLNRSKQLITQLAQCIAGLSQSIEDNTIFFAEQQAIANTTEHHTNQEEQTLCEKTSEFFKCLSLNQTCPIFKYP